LSAGALVLAVAATARPAAAAIVHIGSPTGAYSVSYDPAAQSPVIDQIVGSLGGVSVHVNAAFAGDPEVDGLSNGIQQTIFNVVLHLTFEPTPGHAFTALSVEDGVTGFHHAFFGGEQFDETTTITPLHGGSSQVLQGPHISNIPPWGQGGGGAFAGVVFGSLAPPPGGFRVDMIQTIVLFDSSSWGFSSVDFGLATTDAPIAGAPEPAAWALMTLGFGAVGALLRRRRFLTA
jgi:hypothetical protein